MLLVLKNPVYNVHRIGVSGQGSKPISDCHALIWSWGELLEPTALSLPSNLSEATTRLAQNLTHFRSNYTLVLLTELLLSLLYHPVSIIVFLIIFLYFSRDQPLEVFGFTVVDGVVMVVLGVVTVLALVVVVSVVIGVLARRV
ncbi:hypothetical protein GBA52_025086 [Prunus armeniaca]|nr:hypothetical protein GBA52_025086 [Prunus armeniaca]